MKRTGMTPLPLHSGRAPKRLFDRMRALAGMMAQAIAPSG
ncbi:MAG: DUF763 domain-containing protein [Deltaproteobacteria bacterium]|nr:DUF763 domain-containing protein [Deltaproteobacteria bacterium]